MSKCIDLTGQRFGRTVVTARATNAASGKARWFCVCDCGKTHTTSSDNLRRGVAASCGCLHLELISVQHRTHGMSATSTYRSWSGMKDRCTNPKHKHFKHYGGKGITYDARWKSFDEFLGDMGEAPENRSIDRIDNSVGYNKENCRWATASMQSRNRGGVKLDSHDASLILTLRAKRVPQLKIAAMFGVSVATIKGIEHKRTWQDSAKMPI